MHREAFWVQRHAAAYYGTSVEMRGDNCETRETRVFEDFVEIKQPEIKENALGNEGFFVKQKQLELLKLKGEIYD